MNEFLFQYEKMAPSTWAYLSSLLMIGLFFKFSRFWSVRNLDLILLILLAPGLLLYHYGNEALETALRQSGSGGTPLVDEGVAGPPSTDEQGARQNSDVDAGTDLADQVLAQGDLEPAISDEIVEARTTALLGFMWLFAVGLVLLLRMLLDPTMVRRPLLEPNLSTGGLTFIGCSLFVFLMANVIASDPEPEDLRGPKSAEQLLKGDTVQAAGESDLQHGPGYALLNLIPSIPTMPLLHGEAPTGDSQLDGYVTAAKTMAILAHLATVLGIIGVGYWHFDNLKMGIGAATMYLMLPYTSQMTGRIDHVLPAALLVWAVLCYRRPLSTGVFLGLAIGVTYYPIFLLPLWCSFYWQRGLMRFSVGVISMLAVMVLLLSFDPGEALFIHKVGDMFGIRTPAMDHLQGIWSLGWHAEYRICLLAAFVAMSAILALWPAQKNLGTLLSCSGAVLLATQFWHGYGGGLYMAWYLPFLLLTIFRPNLEDRVALVVLGEGWFPRRRLNVSPVEKAA